MKFLTFVRAAGSSAAPPPAVIEAIEDWAAESTRTGKLVERGGLMPGARVRLSGGEVTVTDGPFTEAKEVIGGYAILQLPSKQAAIEDAVKLMELHKKLWPGWEGETEIRQIFDPDFEQDAGRG
ncbi:MAG TPA: YciI family protein [Thermoanaerobaculia bacterium]|jgi:hypothetical protein